ncbi:MAG: divalent-cation tolerance protein CutA [Blastocatellia bacterium]
MKAIVVITTTETCDQAEKIAQVLVAGELAACVQILPPMTSVYRWQGQIEKNTEHLLLIKTLHGCYAQVEAAIKANHTYQTPEIIALPVETGAADYLAWLTQTIKN